MTPSTSPVDSVSEKEGANGPEIDMKLIEGVRTRLLNIITDERGRLAEILRSDDEIFKKFGQVYFTTAYPGVIKAWHYHKIQTDYFFCVKGRARVALYDSRDDSSTQGTINDFLIGENNPLLIVIPPLVYHGFKTVSSDEAIIINTPTEPYNHDDPDEYRVDPINNDIPYDWGREEK
jgi:dTDP-4-dehydrorhamnose 3,5-epimerase